MTHIRASTILLGHLYFNLKIFYTSLGSIHFPQKNREQGCLVCGYIGLDVCSLIIPMVTTQGTSLALAQLTEFPPHPPQR